MTFEEFIKELERRFRVAEAKEFDVTVRIFAIHGVPLSIKVSAKMPAAFGNWWTESMTLDPGAIGKSLAKMLDMMDSVR